MKILITGSRDWTDVECIRSAFKKYVRKDDIIVEGEARGADTYARIVAEDDYGLEVKKYPANWTKYGRAGGPIRNKQMLDENPDIQLVLAFHSNIDESKGTKDMIVRAKGLLLCIILFTGTEEKIISGKLPIRE